MNEWNIQARSRLCQGCGQAFADRQSYHTLLFEARSGLERQDVCGTCWDEQHRHGAKERKGFISHWQGVFAVPPPPPPEAIRRDSAEALLRRLLERAEPSWKPAAFILAVMLERKRVLRTREQVRSNGRRTFVYEVPKTGEVLVVEDPALELDQLEQVQRDVAQLLEHGLPEPPQPVEEPFAPQMSEEALSRGLGGNEVPAPDAVETGEATTPGGSDATADVGSGEKAMVAGGEGA